jgi:hypothetical protein
MKIRTQSKRAFEFYFADLDTHALVEEDEGGVTIRVTRDTFSEKRKVRFIRELAAEGFISDRHGNFSGFVSSPWLNVRWIKDFSWLKPAPELVAKARRQLVLSIAAGLSIWAVLMGALLSGIFR